MNKCPKCSKTYDDSFSICLSCGVSLNNENMTEQEKKHALQKKQEHDKRERERKEGKKKMSEKLLNLKPIKYVRSLGWNKQDAKAIILVAIMLVVGCIIVNTFLILKVEIRQKRSGRRGFYGQPYKPIYVDVDGDVDAQVSGRINID